MDPNAVVGMHPAAGPKGSGLAMIIDILSSLLSGMPWGPHINRMYGELERRRELGHFLMAIDLGRLGLLESFRSQLGQMIEELTSIAPADGFDRVYFPGEIEGICRKNGNGRGFRSNRACAWNWHSWASDSASRFPAHDDSRPVHNSMLEVPCDFRDGCRHVVIGPKQLPPFVA